MEENDAEDMIQKAFTPEAVVLAAGSFPTHPNALEYLKNAPFLVCCDGAAVGCIRRNYKPDIIIGDGDSLPYSWKRKYASILYQISEQENNDLTKAMHFLLVRGYRKVVILGATGKREDHTIGNVSLLTDYLHQQFEVRMVTNHGVFIPVQDAQTFESAPGEVISIFNIDARQISSEGLKYPLYDFTKMWQGTLNESLCESFTIHASGNYLVFRKFSQ